MYKIIKECVDIRGDVEYLREVQSIVEDGTLWGAIKYAGPLKHIQIDGIDGYALLDNRVIALYGHTYNDILALAKYDVLNDVMYNEPKFATLDEPDSMKIGFFSEIYKNGYIVFPLMPFHDFSNNPIVLKK